MKEYFEKVLCSEELPKEKLKTYLTDIGGAVYFGGNVWGGASQNNPTWWLKPVSLDEVKAQVWEEDNQITEKYWQEYDENGTNNYPTNPYKQ
jgi:hypothetical protein